VTLKEWMNYRKNCPFCESPLITYLHSGKRQSIRYEENRMVVVFPLTAKGKTTTDYKVGYSFGLIDSSFCIEFYDKNLIRYETETPLFLKKRFEELHKNLGNYKFYKNCGSCQKYNYISSLFTLDFKSCTLKTISVRSEYFGFIQNYGGGKDNRFRVYKLLNYYDIGESYINYHITSNVIDARGDHMNPVISTHLQLPLIPFVSEEATLQRIKNLIIFS
jgi:hypothetical protein